MKNLLSLTATLILLFMNQSLNANQTIINQTGPGLEIASSLTFNDEKISDYSIIIYDENQNSDTIEIAKRSTIYMKLSYGHTYSLRFEKAGFRDRVVMIDTRVNAEELKKDLGFDFQIEMIKLNQPNNTLADLPVAVIQYDQSEKRFMYSRTYHRQIRGKEIEESETITP